MNYLIHFSDIHIGKYSNRSDEYRKVFDKLINNINVFQEKNRSIVVITGDIFDKKETLTAQDIDDFHYLMSKITIPVVIIPGNHDLPQRNTTKLDLITPLVRHYPNVRYYRDTTRDVFHGVKFLHVSFLDTPDWEELSLYDDHILLYHGNINRQPIKQVSKFHLVLLGDFHQFNSIAPHIKYSGSLLQLNVGESPEKGLIVWNIAKRKGNFLEIPNEYGYLRIDARGKSLDDIKNITMNLNVPKHLLGVGLLTDSLDVKSQIRIIENNIHHKINKINKIVVSKIDYNDIKNNSFEDVIVDHTEADKDALRAMHNKTATIMRQKWHVTRISWDNLLKYGKGNCINFKVLDGITGIIAPNRAGKSSVIDILLFGLFGIILRGDKKSIINKNEKDGYVKIDFVVNDVKYFISRLDNVKHTVLEFYKEDGNRWLNIAEKSVDATYRKIKTLLGDIDEILATCIYIDDSNDIIRMGRCARRDILARLFGLHNIDSIISDSKKRAKELKTEIEGFEKPRWSNCALLCSTAEVELEGYIIDERAKREELVIIKDKLDINKAVLQYEYIGQQILKLKCENEAFECDVVEHPTGKKPTRYLTPYKKDAEKILRVLSNLTDNIDIEALKTKREELELFVRCEEYKEKEKEKNKNTNNTNGKIDKSVVINIIKNLTHLKNSVPLDLIYRIANKINSPEINNLISDISKNNLVNRQEAESVLKEAKSLIDQISASEQLVLSSIIPNVVDITIQQTTHAKQLINAINDYLQFVEMSQLEKEYALWRAYEENTRQLAKLNANNEQIKKLTEKQKDFSGMVADHHFIKEETRLEGEIATLRESIGKIKYKIEEYRYNAKLEEIQRIKLAPLEEKYRLQLIYTDVAIKLNMVIINRYIVEIKEKVNEVLGHISDFTIDCKTTDKFIDFELHDNGSILPLELGSGFQKFIVSIVFRLILTHSLQSSAQFIIIDEKFGSMDKDNLAKIGDLLCDIKPLYKFMLIISHIDELQSMIEKPLFIKLGRQSYLNNDTSIISCICGGKITELEYKDHIKTKAHKAALS